MKIFDILVNHKLYEQHCKRTLQGQAVRTSLTEGRVNCNVPLALEHPQAQLVNIPWWNIDPYVDNEPLKDAEGPLGDVMTA